MHEAQKEEQRFRLKQLIMLGKEKGHLTYAEINDYLPSDFTDVDYIEKRRKHDHGSWHSRL